MSSTSHSPNGGCILLQCLDASGKSLAENFIHKTFGSRIMLNYCRWFNANHVHGTIMPRQSSVDAPILDYQTHAASSGAHKTVRKKDARKALERKHVRVGYQARKNHWS